MILRNFFPRLRERAWKRYGVRLTERQFTNWREQGLLPGPATPIGRGRGRCPDRHWPATSYRRALRICRYQSGGARRKSEWWLGFWLSGDRIDPAIIRASLKREISIDRRKNRAFSESNRWRNATFSSFQDANRGGMFGSGDLSRSLSLMDLSPDQFRRLLILDLVDADKNEDIELMQEMSNGIWFCDQASHDKIRKDIDQEEYKRFYRPGRLAEGNEAYVDKLETLSESQLIDLPQTWHLRKKGDILLFHVMRLSSALPLERLALFIIPILSRRPIAIKHRIGEILQITFEVFIDNEKKKPYDWRLTGAQASYENMLFTIQMLIQEKRNALKTE